MDGIEDEQALMATMNQEELLDYLARTNTSDYQIIKACEELAELLEVLLKYQTKKGTPKEVPVESIIEEIGDVKIRVALLERTFGREAVQARVDEKLGKFHLYTRECKYIGRI